MNDALPQNNLLSESAPLSPEEVLGPPRIDIVGVGLMLLVAIFVGLFAAIGILIASFFSIGRFSLESGVSPMILAMITFFSMLIGSYIYIWAARTVFPGIYTRNKIFYLQVTIFMIILFICMLPVYLVVGAIAMNTSAILMAYLVHILLAIFGLELLLSIIGQYRYAVLALFANMASLIFSGGILFWIYVNTTSSASALFILMALSILGFVLSTGICFLTRFVYYQYYKATGNDPLGDVFSQIQKEDAQDLQDAQNALLQR